MPITEIAIRNLKPSDKQHKVFDGGGLHMLVTPTGAKRWVLKYRFGGKEKTLAFGTYPEVSLADARRKRDSAREKLAAGIDPGEVKKAEKQTKRLNAENSFEAIAREWHAKASAGWSEKHAVTILQRLEANAFPWVGGKPIADMTPPDALDLLRRVEKRGAVETAHRLKTNVGQVFRYAVATGRASRDITADLRGALPPVQKEHFAAITDPKLVGELLRAIDGYHGMPTIAAALRLAPLVFQRPGEMRQAKWAEFDLDNATWEIPAERMKRSKNGKASGGAHIVPLSRQAVEVLRDLYGMTGRHGGYLFPNVLGRSRPMSAGTVSAGLRRLGFDANTATVHGFRATARTMLDEVLGIPPAIIEAQLAHTVRDPLGRAYNRTAHLPQRREMMQKWADYLDTLKAGANIITMNVRRG